MQAVATSAWTRRGRVATALLACALVVVGSVLALGFYQPSYGTVVTDWVNVAVEALDGDDDLGPLGELTLPDLGDLAELTGFGANDDDDADDYGGDGGHTGMGDGAVQSTTAPLFDLPTAVPAPSTPSSSSSSPSSSSDEDPCADTPRNPHWALSDEARTVLAAYAQIHAQQLQWLKTGDPRFRGVLYQCTANAACGGLGDRLNGVVSAFYLGVMTQRAVFVDITAPVPFDLFLQPSGPVNWHWPPEGWSTYPRGDDVAHLDAIDFYNPLEAQLRTRGANALLDVDSTHALIVFRTNLQFWMDITGSAEYVDRSPLYSLVRPVRDRGDLYALAAAALLRPTCYLAQATKTWEATLFGPSTPLLGPTVPRIGVHLRTGLDPDFHDVHRFQPEHLSTFASRLPSAVAALRSHAPFAAPVNASAPPVIFVVADYPPAIELMLAQLRAADPGTWAAVVTVPLTPELPLTHLERTTLGAIHTPEGNLRTFLEWNLLRKMDAHIIGRTGYSMSASRTVCQPVLYFPKIDTPVAEYIYYPRGMCWPQERPADEG